MNPGTATTPSAVAAASEVIAPGTTTAELAAAAELAAMTTSSTPTTLRPATAFASPCNAPTGSMPTGNGAWTPLPMTSFGASTGANLLDEAATVESPTGRNKACDQSAGGCPPDPLDEDEPAGLAVLRSLRPFAAAAACSGVNAGIIFEVQGQRQTTTLGGGTLLQAR